MTGRRGLAAESLVALAALVGGVVLFALNLQVRSDSIFSVWDLCKELAPTAGFFVTGFVLRARRPGNLIGSICFLIGVLGFVSWLATEYAGYGLLTHPGSLPGALETEIILQGSWAPEMALIVLLVCVFPDGRLLPGRWRLVPWVGAAALAALFAVGMTTTPSAPFQHVHNPLHVSSSSPLLLPIFVALPAAIASVVGAVATVVARYRRARQDEREQLKWLILAAVVLPVGLLAHSVADALAPGADNTIELIFSVCVTAFPIAIGIAVLKYRLYDIDRLISRTISYLLVTGVLVGVFVGIVLLTTRVLPFSSPVGVAASTLAAAALFNPLRRRVQGLVDHRFNRTRYDAEAVLAAFGDRLRGAVDLESVQAGLLAAASQATSPAHASIWLRNDPETVTR